MLLLMLGTLMLMFAMIVACVVLLFLDDIYLNSIVGKAMIITTLGMVAVWWLVMN